MKSANFLLPDMNCASCVNTIESSLRKNSGVTEAIVNFATEKMMVKFDESQLSEDDIVEIVRKVGYKAVLDNDGGNTVHKIDHTTMNHSKMGHEESDMNMEDHSAHASSESDTEIKNKRDKTILAGILSIFILSMMFVIDLPNEMFIMLITSLIILLYSGRDFFIKGIPSLVLRGRPNMDTLIALGVGTAFLYSSYITLFTNIHEEYFMDVGIITTFIMFGRYLEARAKGRASEALKKLLELGAKTAHRIGKNGEVEEVSVNVIQIGDILLIKPGEKIPVDGVVIEGNSSIDESMVTGESMPVSKSEGADIIGATINGNTAFKMKATKIGKDTILARIMKLVENAQMTKMPIQKLVDIVSNYFVWVVIIIAIITFGTWFAYTGNYSNALIYTVAVLIIACPCALGLATPISVVVGSGRGSELGILLKDASVLEKMHRVTAIAFDKTGTITKGKPEVTEIDLKDEKHTLNLVTALESQSEHPLSDAIVRYGNDASFGQLKVEKFEAVIGKGVTGIVEGSEVTVGNDDLMKSLNIILDEGFHKKTEELQSQGKTVVQVAIDRKIIGIIAIADTVKESSKAAISKLQNLGIKTIMLTGDNKLAGKYIAKSVGIDEVFANVKPDEKVNIVKELQEKGEFVAMVGDGINDSPALAQADVGIAMGTGTDIAMESGDVVLVHGDIEKAYESILLSRSTLKNIKQNLFWAFVYNTVGIPIAAFGFLNPAVSAFAMAFSSISVVLNALRLKRIKL